MNEEELNRIRQQLESQYSKSFDTENKSSEDILLEIKQWLQQQSDRIENDNFLPNLISQLDALETRHNRLLDKIEQRLRELKNG